MPKRIFLVHPTPLALPPVDEAFKTLWPQAQVVNLLDKSLYADVGANGELTPALYARVANLFRHCEASGADGIVFSGSTFGPAVEEGRKGITVPVLRIEEAMMDEAVARGGSILVVSTQKRAHAGGARHARCRGQARRQVADDQGALGRGRARRAQRRRQRQARPPDRRAIGGGRRFRHRSCSSMISMAPARAKMPPALAEKTLTSGETAVARMRKLLGE